MDSRVLRPRPPRQTKSMSKRSPRHASSSSSISQCSIDSSINSRHQSHRYGLIEISGAATTVMGNVIHHHTHHYHIVRGVAAIKAPYINNVTFGNSTSEGDTSLSLEISRHCPSEHEGEPQLESASAPKTIIVKPRQDKPFEQLPLKGEPRTGSKVILIFLIVAVLGILFAVSRSWTRSCDFG